MGCGMSKIDNREEEMEQTSMYVYYNPLHHRPEDHLVERCRKKAADPVDHEGGDNNNGVFRPTQAEVVVSECESGAVEETPAEPVMKETNRLHTMSFRNVCDGSDGEMKKFDAIIDALEKEDDHDSIVDTCTEIILPTQRKTTEIACKNEQLPTSMVSLKKSRKKWRPSRKLGPRNCSVSVKNLVDATATPTRRRYHSSDIVVKY